VLDIGQPSLEPERRLEGQTPMKFLGTTWTRNEKYALVAIFSLALVLMALRQDETPVGSFTDDAYYIEMARSIAEGLGPVVHIGPDEPTESPDIFPPGFPYLLSPLALLFPHSLVAMKLVPLWGTILLFPLCLWLPGPAADNRMRLAIAAVVMLNPWVIAWSGRVLSDNPYSAVSLGALILFLRITSLKTIRKRDFFLLVVLCSSAVCVRTIGWSLVLAITGIWIWQRCFSRALVFLLSTIGLLLPVWLTSSRGGSPLTGAYIEQMFSRGDAKIWNLILGNIVNYVRELPVILMPLFGAPIEGVLRKLGMGPFYPVAAFLTGVVFLFLVGWAILKRWKNPNDGPRVRLFAWFLLVYAAVLANFDGYPSGVQTRLLIPVFPLLVWLVFAGLQDLFGKRFRTVVPLVFGVMIVASLAHNGWRIARPLRTTVSAEGNGFVDPGEGAEWVLERTGSLAVIMAQEPLQRHIHFRRAVVGFPDLVSDEVFSEVIKLYDVEYVFVGPSVHFQPNRLDEKGNAVLRLLQGRPELYVPLMIEPERGIYLFGCRETGSI
jgi:hypothetical protein